MSCLVMPQDGALTKTPPTVHTNIWTAATVDLINMFVEFHPEIELGGAKLASHTPFPVADTVAGQIAWVCESSATDPTGEHPPTVAGHPMVMQGPKGGINPATAPAEVCLALVHWCGPLNVVHPDAMDHMQMVGQGTGPGHNYVTVWASVCVGVSCCWCDSR